MNANIIHSLDAKIHNMIYTSFYDNVSVEEAAESIKNVVGFEICNDLILSMYDALKGGIDD